jgi:hypothetical protein
MGHSLTGRLCLSAQRHIPSSSCGLMHAGRKIRWQHRNTAQTLRRRC